jgi:hypothetical protein
MSEYKLINVRVFHPAAKDVKERCEYTYCNNCENCELYKQRKCLHDYRYFGCIQCPYGKYSQEQGYTQKAKSFYSWMNNKKETYKDVLNAVEFYTDKLAKVGEYIYLPYPHLKNYVNSLNGLINEHFLKEADFTSQKILEIINFRPQALMGGEIRDFQIKEVPKFIQHLKEELPEKYNEFVKTYPEKTKQYSEIASNYIGRKAYIKTLKIGTAVVDIHGDSFIFDGEYLYNENFKPSFAPFDTKGGLFKFKVTDDMVVKITNNEQVINTTKFID